MAFLLLIMMFIFVAIVAPKLAISTAVISLATGFVIKFTSSLMNIETTIAQSIKAALLAIFLNILANQAVAKLMPNAYLSFVPVFILSTLAFSYILGAKFIQAIVISTAFWVFFFLLAFSVFGFTFTASNA